MKNTLHHNEQFHDTGHARDHQHHQEALLKAAFPFIDTHGWSETAFLDAANALGEPALYYHLFPQGLPDTILAYGTLLDQQVDEKLSHIPFEAMGTTEKITLLVLTRIQLQRRHKGVARALMKKIATPRMLIMAPQLLTQTINHMWYRAGDRATDFNYYTKRGLLGVIYADTLVYSLTDATDQSVEQFFKKQLRTVFKGTTAVKTGFKMAESMAKTALDALKSRLP